MFRAHYAEFDKTMRHENANSIRYVAKKKLREEYSTPIFPPHCFSSTSKKRIGLRGFWVNNLPGKKSETAIIKVFPSSHF